MQHVAQHVASNVAPCEGTFKINTPVHYHVKKYRICKNKICQIPGTFFDGNMVVSAGMAHIRYAAESGSIPFLQFNSNSGNINSNSIPTPVQNP